jgi:hypothetical protein
MGRRSRNRVRSEQQSARQSQAQTGRRDPCVVRRSDPGPEIERHFSEALRLFYCGDGEQAGYELAALGRWWGEGTGRVADITPGFVPALLCLHLCGKIELAWERGWQPADIPRVVSRLLSSTHAQLAVEAIAEQAETYRYRQRTLPTWMDQLDQIGASLQWSPATDHLALFALAHGIGLEALLKTGFELLFVLHHLPEVPLLGPPPAKWDTSAALDAALAWRKRERGGELRHLERVRALLAKAESTEFDEEADALTEKAQELMARYSIDAALLAAHAAGKRIHAQPKGVRIGIDDPYSHAKAILLATIAEASGCRTVWSKDFGFSTVFGFEGELRSVDLLYTSLLLQARRAMMRTGAAGRRARSRSFRQSFLIGFATRIGQRLEESVDAVISDVLKEQGDALLPVLAERSRVVEDHRDQAFPKSGEHSLSIKDWSGWVVGTAAADAADIARGPLLDKRATA